MLKGFAYLYNKVRVMGPFTGDLALVKPFTDPPLWYLGAGKAAGSMRVLDAPLVVHKQAQVENGLGGIPIGQEQFTPLEEKDAVYSGNF